ncbi:MAG: ABC transporter substrate-binding protein [bacterium]|nr:ABC transporter substrate-binding protein [bacterium]
MSACATPPRVGVPEPAAKPAPEAAAPAPKKAAAGPAREREELLKYQEAVRLFREEMRPEEAFQMLESFGQMHPDSVYADDALLEQSRIHLHLGEPRKAVSLINRLLEKYPGTSLKKRAFMELALIHKDQGRWKDCIEAAQSVLTLSPLPDEEADILAASAVCRAERRDREGAFADLVRGYRAAMTDDARAKALAVLGTVTANLNDRGIESILAGSDGFEPYGTLAMILIERDLEKGYNAEAMSTLMDLLINYPGELPDERVQAAYSLIQDRLLVRTNTIGAVLPLSGRYAVFGQKALQGIQAAFDFQLPDTGREPGAFNLVVKDSGADPVQAAQAVRDLSESDQVIAIIGPIFSRTTRAAAEAAEESKTPMISLSPDPEIPYLGKNVFRRALVDAQQVSSLVRMVSDRLLMTRFAFLYPDNAYGKEMMHRFWDQVDLRGGEVVAAESFPEGQTDFGPQIRAMVGLNRKMTAEELARKESGIRIELEPVIDFEALFIPADFQTVGLMAPQLAFYDVNEVLVLGTDGWNSPWLVELGENHVEGTLFTGGYVHDLENPQVRELTEKYWLAFGEDAQSMAVQAWDSARIIRAGIESGQVTDRSSLREYLMGLRDYPSAEGPLTTDGNGDILQRPFLLTVESGQIVPYEIEFD